MTEVSSLTGRLLVATPKLADPNFDRAVVLLLDHDVEGTLGVVLNRPTPVGVGDVLETWAALAGTPQVVFQGGPVSLDSALALAVVPGEPRPDEGSGLLGWRRVHGAIGLVDLEAPPELLAAELGSLRIFAGYSGWGPGQLEKELVDGAWYLVESEPGDVSTPDPERMWRSVLRRQRNELAMVATYPDDPSLN
ncbi:MAG: YqgE/AlgH family protein [Actinomycetia bacterium]|nr:YqgE/AlgH family protein [Actinomycetes bacterium]MCL2730827.1 YqgE/AlgH family protein [Actinomycetes bacterium]